MDSVNLPDLTLRIDTVEYHSKTCAPWISTELFVTGCYKRCPGCFNKDLQSFDAGTRVSIKELYWDFIRNVPYRRVTFGGGEPFLQAKELSYLAKALRDEGFVIVCYSGYTADELPYLFPYAQDLLENIDMLVDGPFIQELLIPIVPIGAKGKKPNFIGSSNQRMINVQKSLDEGRIILWTEEDTLRVIGKEVDMDG